MLKVGLIGYGYWGPNLARNFHTHPDCELVRIVDMDDQRRGAAANAYRSGVGVTGDVQAVTKAADIDVVVIATPVFTHFELALEALNNGKHVWLEKPMTSTSDQAKQLVEVALRKKLTVCVGHTFLFTGAVQKIKELVTAKDFGDIFYYDSVRINLGLFQSDVNVLWDLAPHDLSIMDHLLGNGAEAVSATGGSHFLNGIIDVGYLTVFYPKNVTGHIHVNWLSPVKIRKTLVGGSKSMIVWDDLASDEQVKIYDRGVEVKPREGRHKILTSYRTGAAHIPVIGRQEALYAEVGHFLGCIKSGTTPINSGESGLRVVRMLEASDASLAKSGAPVKL